MEDASALEESLATVRKRMRAISDKERYKRKRGLEKEDPEHVTPHVQRCCVYIYVLSNYTTQSAAEYLSAWRARSGAMAHPLDKLEDAVRTFVLAWPEKKLADWHEPVAPQDKRAKAAAQQFCDERQLHVWLTDFNRNSGQAPRTSVLGDKLDEIRHLQLATGDPAVVPRANTGAVKNRVFFTRWRRKFRTRYGTVPASGHVEQPELQKKVCRAASDIVVAVSHTR